MASCVVCTKMLKCKSDNNNLVIWWLFLFFFGYVKRLNVTFRIQAFLVLKQISLALCL